MNKKDLLAVLEQIWEVLDEKVQYGELDASVIALLHELDAVIRDLKADKSVDPPWIIKLLKNAFEVCSKIAAVELVKMALVWLTK